MIKNIKVSKKLKFNNKQAVLFTDEPFKNLIIFLNLHLLGMNDRYSLNPSQVEGETF